MCQNRHLIVCANGLEQWAAAPTTMTKLTQAITAVSGGHHDTCRLFSAD